MSKKTFTFVLMLLMVMTGATMAQPATVGPFKITGGSSGDDYEWSGSGNTLTIKSTTELTIENSDKETPYAGTISLDCTGAQVILAGVNLKRAGSVGGSLFVEKNATITLQEGTTNILKGHDSYGGSGIRLYGSNTLTIKGKGLLVAEGTDTSEGLDCGDGDGITVEGGTVKVTSAIDNAIKGKFTIDGDCFVVAQGELPESATLTKGIIFEGNVGTIHGSPTINSYGAEVPAGATLTVNAGENLAIADGTTLTNKGRIVIEQGATYDAANIQDETNGVVIDNNSPAPTPGPDPVPPYFNWYNISIPAAEGVTIVRNDREFDSYNIDVIEASSLSFSLQAKEGYDLTNVVVTTSRGEILTPREEDGRYLIREVNEDVEVTIKGAVPLANEEISREGTAIYSADGQIFVEVPETVTAYVYTATGALKYSGTLSAGSNRIAISGSGIYFVRLSNGAVKKVVM